MVSQDQVYEAVSSVESPLFTGRSLGDLGLLKAARKKLGGKVKLELALPSPDRRAALSERVEEALAPFGDAADIKVEVMGEETAAAWMRDIVESSGPAVGEPGCPTRTIAVSSGKGGVGKSSVAANLGVALRRAGKKAGILDGDIWGFSIPSMMGIAEPPALIGDSIIPPAAHGVKVMSMDYFVGDDKAVIWRGPMLHRAVEQFLKDVFWDDLDFLIVDMPPGTGDIAISMAQFLPRAQVLVVTTPQPTAQRVARRAALMAAEVDQEVIGIVENMSWFVGDDGKRYELFGAGGGKALSEELGVDLMAQIPLLPDMGRGADEGEPAVVAAAGSEAEEAFDKLAAAVLEKRPRVRTNPNLVINPVS